MDLEEDTMVGQEVIHLSLDGLKDRIPQKDYGLRCERLYGETEH
jgi:hypothetical protein